MNRGIWKGLATASLLAIGMAAMTQPATPAQKGTVKPKSADEPYATVHMRASIGSFRMMDSEGRAEIKFSGTILISQLNGQVTPTGNLRKEFDKYDRVIYTGDGSIVIQGSWRAAHWFGRDMSAVWYGRGICRVIGEFDRNMKTGEFWYDDPGKKYFWQTTGIVNVHLPEQVFGYDKTAKPVRRVKKPH